MPEETKSKGVHNLFVWRSPSRQKWAYSKGVLALIGLSAVTISIFFILFQEWLALFVTWAAFFLFWNLTRIPAEMVEHKITTQGIISLGRSYLWQELGPFWFTISPLNETVLHIANRSPISHLTLVVEPSDQEKIRDIIAEYLPFVEVVEKSPWDKLLEWAVRKFP